MNHNVCYLYNEHSCILWRDSTTSLVPAFFPFLSWSFMNACVLISGSTLMITYYNKFSLTCIKSMVKTIIWNNHYEKNALHVNIRWKTKTLDRKACRESDCCSLYVKDLEQEGANECKHLNNMNIVAMSSKNTITIITIKRCYVFSLFETVKILLKISKLGLKCSKKY